MLLFQKKKVLYFFHLVYSLLSYPVIFRSNSIASNTRTVSLLSVVELNFSHINYLNFEKLSEI